MRSRRGRLILAAAAVLGLLAAACSDDGGSDPADTTTDAGDSTTTTALLEEAVDGGDDAGDLYVPGFGATGYDVEDYALDLRWRPPNRLSGTATLHLVPQEALRSFALDLDGLQVRGVDVDGAEAAFGLEGIELTIVPEAPLPADEPVEVVIEYGGTPGQAHVAEHLEPVGWTRDGDVAFALGQPVGSSTWFPANEAVADKATWSLDLTVPRDTDVASNGELEGRDRQGRTTTWSWRMEHPMTPSLAMVAIGAFDLVEGEGPHDLPLLSFVSEGLDVRDDLAGIGEMITAFEILFGPYPFDSYGVVALDTDFPYALETQGRSFLPRGTTDPVTQAHELAHQWFGDSVTPTTWADIWLNEGFATYAEHLWLDASEPRYDIDTAMADLRDPSLRGPTQDPGPLRIYDEVVYQRGALTLHALRQEIGDRPFFRLLHRWARRHQDGTVTTQDFIALAEDVADQRLQRFFRDWLDDERLPPADG
jgi:aminopeptidase N